MKPNELMIGDLIYVYGHNGIILSKPHWYIRRVTADWIVDMDIREAHDKKLKDCGVVIPEQQLFIGDTRPIHLTEEILKANGIPTNGYTYFFDSDINHCLELLWADGELLWTIDSAKYCIIHFAYVHELQHALRLCGLNELADNFKIKGGDE